MPAYIVTLHGRDFHIPIVGDDDDHPKIARGFKTFRKVTAENTTMARELAEHCLLAEAKVRGYIESTEAEWGERNWSIRSEKIMELSWFGRLFHRTPPGFILYEND